MNRMLGISLFVIALILAGIAGAVTVEDFKVDTTQDIVDLCSTPVDDQNYIAAIHFCHGFLTGAYQYHELENSGPEGKRLVCFPDPPPARNEVIRMFLEWAKAHPEYMNEEAVDTEFRFLIETWPCEETSSGLKGSKP